MYGYEIWGQKAPKTEVADVLAGCQDVHPNMFSEERPIKVGETLFKYEGRTWMLSTPRRVLRSEPALMPIAKSFKDAVQELVRGGYGEVECVFNYDYLPSVEYDEIGRPAATTFGGGINFPTHALAQSYWEELEERARQSGAIKSA